MTQLLSTYLGKFGLAPVFTEEEVEHYLMSRPGVVSAFVVESAGRVASQPCWSRVQGPACYLCAAGEAVAAGCSLCVPKDCRWNSQCEPLWSIVPVGLLVSHSPSLVPGHLFVDSCVC